MRVEFDEEHKDSRFHQCAACGWFARSPEELLAHQLSAHFADVFEEREIEVEPPKGKYTTVKATGSATLVPVDEECVIVFVYLTPKGLPPHVRCMVVPWPI